MTAARLVARTVRGIEDVVATEIHHRKLGRIDHIGHREVLFRCASPDAALALRTADDVFLVAAEVTGVGHTKADLRLLAEAAEAVDVQRDGNSVDVSASFLGRRNYTRFDVEDAVGVPLAAALGVPYRTRRAGRVPPPGGLSWRVTIADDRAVLALRIADRPLHRRSYRVCSRPGGLHPPLAAAMVRLAAPAPGATMMDPFCGTGTIPIEAAGGVRIVAGDRDPAALAAAMTNAGTRRISWMTADAASLPVADGAIDLVVTNPPWARQVAPTGALARHPERFWHELRRVLRPGGHALVLLPVELLTGAERADFTVTARRPVSLSGRHPEVVRLS